MSAQLRRLRFESLDARLLLYAAVLSTAAEGEAGPPLEQVADFSLIDVNPTSPKYNTAVSPRDYIGQVSGWYFGHAT